MKSTPTENSEPERKTYSDHGVKMKSALIDPSQLNESQKGRVHHMNHCVKNDYVKSIAYIDDSVKIEPKPLKYNHFSSVCEMKKFGAIHYINTEEELDNWLRSEVNADKCCLYRGHADASWLMKSTLLRAAEAEGSAFFSLQKQHFEQVKEWMERENIGSMPNEDQILFYAQHYGQKSSLLDFTFDPHIALFFASENNEPEYGDSELADYISVIKLDVEKEMDFFNWRNSKQTYNTESVVDVLSSNIHQPVWIEEKFLNNQRMSAQKGAFVYLSKHSDCSVESVFKEMSEKRNWKPMISYHLVSRNLFPCIRKKLASLNITRRSMHLAVEKTLFLGNGFSRAVCKNMLPWGELLASEKSHIKNYTILYEVGFLKKTLNGDDEQEQKEKLMERLNSTDICNELNAKECEQFGVKLKQLNITNIITTNYDAIIEKILEKGSYNSPIEYSVEKTYSIRRKKTYRSSLYNHEVTLWKIHGEQTLCKTPTLGLDHYCGYVTKLSNYLKGEYISSSDKAVECRTSMEDKCKNLSWDNLSWVELFFKTDLYISGFGMDFSEIDIWWVLNRRARLAKKLGYTDNRIYFLYSHCYDSKKYDIFEALDAFNVHRHGICTCADYMNNMFETIETL